MAKNLLVILKLGKKQCLIYQLNHIVYWHCRKTRETADLVTFTEEILNGKLHFCAVWEQKFSFF